MDGELETLGERIAEHAAHFDAAMHRLLTDLREFDQRGGWHRQGASSCAHWLAWRVGWDLVTARDRVRVARKLPEFPAIDDALRRGEVSYSKVRAVLRVATSANADLLLDYAKLMPAAQLEKLTRKYAYVQRHGQEPHPLSDQHRRYVQRRDTEDGMVKIVATLHPEEAELVWTMLNRAAAQLMHGPAEPVIDASAESRAETQAPVRAGAVTSRAGADGGRGNRVVESAPAESQAGTQSPVHSGAVTSLAGADGGCGNGVVEPADASHGGYDAGLVSEARIGRGGRPEAAAEPCRETRATAREQTSTSRLSDAVAGDDIADSDPSLSPVVVRWHGNSAESPRAAGTGPSGRALADLHQGEDAVKRAFNRADALVSLAQQYLRGDQPDRSPIEVMVTIPQACLRAEIGVVDPLEVGEIGESLVSGDAARRLSCDAGVVECVENEQGTPLSVGRKRRTIAGALKRALHKRDKVCTFPGCTHRMFLEGHHFEHWADGGDTSLENLGLLCSTHHRYVHEYGYTVELGPDQRPRFRDPHGREVMAVPAPPEIGELGWSRIRAANAPLTIDADTIACEWDGRPVDYGAIIGHLVDADGLQ